MLQHELASWLLYPSLSKPFSLAWEIKETMFYGAPQSYFFITTFAMVHEIPNSVEKLFTLSDYPSSLQSLIDLVGLAVNQLQQGNYLSYLREINESVYFNKFAILENLNVVQTVEYKFQSSGMFLSLST